MMYVLIFIQTFVYSQSPYYQMDKTLQPNALSDDYWLIIENLSGFTTSTCDGGNVYGGQGAFTHDTIISKVFFDLTPHYKIRIEINLLWFNLELAELKFENDNTEISIIFPATTQTKSCPETSFVYQMNNLVFEFPHQRRNYIFSMFQDYFSFTDATWGFDSFKLQVYTCPPECLQCSGQDDLNCYLWSKLQFSFIQCDFENSDIYQWGDGLVDTTIDEFGGCKGIQSISLENLFLLPPSGKILIRFLINKNSELTIWINENRIEIQQKGVIELILEKQFGPTLNMKIRDLNNILDWMIRDLEIYYQQRPNQFEIIIPQIYQGCRVLNDQFCMDCQEGWEQDELQYICMTQCGDKIISGCEECDDGNQIQYDGCYECKFQCIEFCQTCIYGICQQCLDGYSLNNNQECTQNCQNKIIIPYYKEECTGENFLQFHGCFQCLKQVECSYGCSKCDLLQCYQCQLNFILIQGRCLSNCGRNDEILYEDCEDFNEVNIELQCSSNCITCNLQQCIKCDDQYEILEDGSCGFKIEQDLDHFNQLIEQVDMTCSKTTFECNYFKSPQLILSYLNITMNKQYVSVEFTEQVKSQQQTPLSSTLGIEIFNISKQMYSYDVIIIQDSGEFVNNVKLILKIEIFELIETKPILSINLNQSLVNTFEQRVIQGSTNLTLEFSQYLNENEMQISNKLTSVTKSSIYALFAVCGISLLFGRFQSIFVILNMLQYLSILRYINLKFPQNLDIYFQAYDLMTIEPLLNLLPIDLLNDITFTNLYKESKGKFKYYEQNADLISNLYCQILQCVIFLMFGLVIRYINRLVYNHIFCPKYFYCMDKATQFIKPSYILKFNQFVYYGIRSFIVQIQELITYQGIKQLLFLNGWDLIFKVLLYLNSIQSLYSSRDILQITVAIIIFSSYLFLILYSELNFKFTVKLISDNNTLQILNLFKQALQLYLLIYLDCSEIIQLGSFFITSLVNLKLIITYRHVIANSQFLINAIVEGSVLLFTLTSFIYIEDFEQYILVSYKTKCGWVHIVILSLGLFSELAIIFKDTIKSIMLTCKKQEDIKINNNTPIVV